MTIPLQSGIIYGPVQSRRLGRSLGINIVSTKIKTCTFNCVYCQYGLRRISTDLMRDPHWYPSVNQVKDKLEQVLAVLNPGPAYITFSGNGESTLHPEFYKIVMEVKRLRDQYTSGAKVAILSNSSTVMNPHIRKALHKLDKRIMKLDCGDEETFKHFNQPIPGIIFTEIINGLHEINDLTIQALFADGSAGNYTKRNVEKWLKIITQLKPQEVQIYTLDRSYPPTFIQPLPREKLMILKQHLMIIAHYWNI